MMETSEDLGRTIIFKGYLIRAPTATNKEKYENTAYSGYYALTRGSLDCYKTDKMVSINLYYFLYLVSPP